MTSLFSVRFQHQAPYLLLPSRYLVSIFPTQRHFKNKLPYQRATFYTSRTVSFVFLSVHQTRSADLSVRAPSRFCGYRVRYTELKITCCLSDCRSLRNSGCHPKLALRRPLAARTLLRPRRVMARERARPMSSMVFLSSLKALLSNLRVLLFSSEALL
ncbi:hypothetical protein BDZ45DRAFT_799209 [Acephala macrosclerotiorum]|nr:hypothetical protein BDZ45DRAFT_799209 [Acephala macrosclerotiorum]